MNTFMNRMIKRIIFGNTLQPKLGRWTTQQSMTEMNRKIDLANTDHCGTCETPRQNTGISYIPIEDDIIEMDSITYDKEIDTLVYYSGFYHKK